MGYSSELPAFVCQHEERTACAHQSQPAHVEHPLSIGVETAAREPAPAPSSRRRRRSAFGCLTSPRWDGMVALPPGTSSARREGRSAMRIQRSIGADWPLVIA